MRKALDSLYLLGGVLGGIALAAIAAIIIAQVVGRQFGLTVLGADDLTAFSVAASATLPLAYAFRHGINIGANGVVKDGVQYLAMAMVHDGSAFRIGLRCTHPAAPSRNCLDHDQGLAGPVSCVLTSSAKWPPCATNSLKPPRSAISPPAKTRISSASRMMMRSLF